ncbi:MAG TPA: TrbG/VirB9 family P-type conjugative transfer protein, partial [Caulobacteraceae bacterium]
KPMAKAPLTNLTVVTNMRRYTFELSTTRNPRGAGDRGVIYDLRFEYPAPARPIVTTPQPPQPKPPEEVNHDYSYEGSAQNLPLRVFDDGHATYFRFAADASYPAIFAVEADKSEAVVNFRTLGGYLVVDRLAGGFVLRRGKVETRIFNDGFHEASAGPLSPRPRHKSRRWFP